MPHKKVTVRETKIDGVIFVLNRVSAVVSAALTAQSKESVVEVIADKSAHTAKTNTKGLVIVLSTGSKGLTPAGIGMFESCAVSPR